MGVAPARQKNTDDPTRAVRPAGCDRHQHSGGHRLLTLIASPDARDSQSVTQSDVDYHSTSQLSQGRPCSGATLLCSIGRYAHARNNLSALHTTLGLSKWWLAVHLFDDPIASRPVPFRVRCQSAGALCGEDRRHARCDRCLAYRHLLVSARATTRSCGLNERTRRTCFTLHYAECDGDRIQHPCALPACEHDLHGPLFAFEWRDRSVLRPADEAQIDAGIELTLDICRPARHRSVLLPIEVVRLPAVFTNHPQDTAGLVVNCSSRSPAETSARSNERRWLPATPVSSRLHVNRAVGHV